MPVVTLRPDYAAPAGPPPRARPHVCYVIGPPRSGTTLVGYLLAGGAATLSLSEPFLTWAILPDWALQRFYCKYQRSAGLRRRRPPFRPDRTQFQRFLHRMAAENGFDALVVKETYRRTGLSPQWHNEPLLEWLVRSGAPAVGLIRQPCDLAASSLHLFRWVTGPRRWLVRLRAPHAPAFRDRTAVVRWAAQNWNAFVAWARRHQLPLFRYEDIISQPQIQLPVICQRCGLEFRETMLDHRHPRSAFGGMGDWRVLRTPRPIDRRSVGRGGELTEGQRAVVRELCAATARELGYVM